MIRAWHHLSFTISQVAIYSIGYLYSKRIIKQFQCNKPEIYFVVKHSPNSPYGNRCWCTSEHLKLNETKTRILLIFFFFCKFKWKIDIKRTDKSDERQPRLQSDSNYDSY